MKHTVYVMLAAFLTFLTPTPKASHGSEYLPVWDTRCALGTDLAEGCAAVRAREVADSTQAPWHAVGRVNIAGLKNRSHCTGTLIGPRLVATAAHCLYVRTQNRWAAPNDVHFVAGYRRGEYVAHGTARHYQVADRYDISSNAFTYDPRDDWALIELAEPLSDEIRPLKWTAFTQTGLDQKWKIVVAGYPAIRPHVLSVDRACGTPVLIEGGALLAQSCATMKGDSGGPVLLFRGGTATLIAIHSGGRATSDGKVTPISIPISAFKAAFDRAK
jgi:protease YdgD